MKQESEYEKCISCFEITNISKSTPIDQRLNYIEGAGQLCDPCKKRIYNLEKTMEEYNYKNG